MAEFDSFEEKHITLEDRESLSKVPPELRPCRILHFYIRHLIRTNKAADFKTAVLQLTERLSLSLERIKDIIEGYAPTSYETSVICKKLGWSIFFLFGVKQETIIARGEQYFSAIGVSKPSRKQLKEFKELYERLLRLTVARVREEKNGHKK